MCSTERLCFLSRDASNAAAAGLSAKRKQLTGHCLVPVSASATNTVKETSMNIIVCMKQVLDPEIPPVKFKVDTGALKVVPPEGIPPVINPYDANAVELALKLKEKHGGRITVLTVGEPTVVDAVKHAIAMGADEGFIIHDEAFRGSDSYSLAAILTKAIGKTGDFDLVIFGRQAADWDEGLVGPIVAENLGLPIVTQVKAAVPEGRELHMTRTTLDGSQIFAAPMPVAITVGSEVGLPRLPAGWGIIQATRKQVPVWNALDIGISPNEAGPDAARRKLVKLFIPNRGRTCEMITRDTLEEAGAGLAERLKEVGAL
jgi:electron transfer flavoprotein beta subunit